MLNKKASLEISIQAIVIVVLAMTLLGLGLGFIKGMFGNINKLSEGTFGKIEEQLQRDLVNSNERLVFSQTKISVERGKSVLLGWGIKNEGNAKLNYWAEFTPIRCPSASGTGVGTCPTLADINTNWFTFKYNPGGSTLPYTVEAAAQKVERVDLAIPKTSGTSGISTGLYLFEMAIYDGQGTANKYATADIFITVT